MTVAVHGERDRRVTRQLLGQLRMNSGGCEESDERLPESVEVHDFFCRRFTAEEIAIHPACMLTRITLDFLT